MESEVQEVEIVEGASRRIVGTAKSYTMETRTDIPNQWRAFFEAGYEIAEATGDAMYGLSFSHDGQGGFRYGVGVEVTQAPKVMPDGCCEMHLSGGTHAVRRVFGPMTELPGQMDWMFCDWLPGSGFELREGAVFERYPHDARNTPEVMAYELWLPVREA